MTDPSGRRGFFRPQRLLRAVGRLQRSLEDSAETIERWASEPVVTLRRKAMACDFEIQFGILQPDRRAAMDAFDAIDRLEAQMTVYDENSEISRLNATAYPGPVPVEPLLFGLLARCADLYRETEGAFDITAGPLIRAWGFRRRRGRRPDPEETPRILDTVGMDKVVLDTERKTVRFTRMGMELNLGAIGKGYALDRVAPRFRQAGYEGVLLSAGHSSLLALGKPTWDDCWQVDVAHPLDHESMLARVRLRDCGFSTSGIAEQSFEQDGRRYGHLLDPGAGAPVEGMLQTSVRAPDATLAEALSTAFFVLGVEWASAYCARHPGVGAILVPDPGPDRPLRPVLLGAIDARLFD